MRRRARVVSPSLRDAEVEREKEKEKEKKKMKERERCKIREKEKKKICSKKKRSSSLCSVSSSFVRGGRSFIFLFPRILFRFQKQSHWFSCLSFASTKVRGIGASAGSRRESAKARGSWRNFVHRRRRRFSFELVFFFPISRPRAPLFRVIFHPMIPRLV